MAAGTGAAAARVAGTRRLQKARSRSRTWETSPVTAVGSQAPLRTRHALQVCCRETRRLAVPHFRLRAVVEGRLGRSGSTGDTAGSLCHLEMTTASHRRLLPGKRQWRWGGHAGSGGGLEDGVQGRSMDSHLLLRGTSKARKSREREKWAGTGAGGRQVRRNNSPGTRDRTLGEGDNNNKANFPGSEFPEKYWDSHFSVRKGTYSTGLAWVVCKDRTQRPSGRNCLWLTQLPLQEVPL